MSVVNCVKCGRMFQNIGEIKICSRCRETEDEMFKAVKEYIHYNPGATVDEVAEAVEVPEKKILKFLKEGRLETSGESTLINCEKCGTPIKTGRYCSSCKRQLTMGLKEAAKDVREHIEPKVIPKEKKKLGAGMHTSRKN